MSAKVPEFGSTEFGAQSAEVIFPDSLRIVRRGSCPPPLFAVLRYL